MDNYVTGTTIRGLREAKGLTQEELAASIHVGAKAVSKWETGRGFPEYAPEQNLCLPSLRQRYSGHRRSRGQLLRDHAAPAGG